MGFIMDIIPIKEEIFGEHTIAHYKVILSDTKAAPVCCGMAFYDYIYFQDAAWRYELIPDVIKNGQITKVDVSYSFNLDKHCENSILDIKVKLFNSPEEEAHARDNTIWIAINRNYGVKAYEGMNCPFPVSKKED